VDLPWSTWAMMEKLRMFRIESEDIGGGGARRRQGNGRLSHARRLAAKTASSGGP
jgi:hypothetical protein